jgi:hypothetical protein
MADLDGFNAMMGQLTAAPLRVVAATERALAQAGHYLEGQIKDALGLTSHPPGTPTPSAPGTPPSLVTGPASWSVSVGMESAYARVQELGGGPSRLPARPYVAPAFAASLPKMAALIERAWADALDI